MKKENLCADMKYYGTKTIKKDKYKFNTTANFWERFRKRMENF